jgi:ATP-dependent Lon protease
MKLNWVEQMDEVLEIALTQKLPKLTEELPEVLVGAALPIPVGPGAENVTRQ